MIVKAEICHATEKVSPHQMKNRQNQKGTIG